MFQLNPNIFEKLFDSIPEAVLIVNEKQQLVSFNHGSEKLFGYKKNEILNKPFSILIPKKFHSIHSNFFETYINSNNSNLLNTYNLLGLAKNDKTFIAEIKINKIKIKNEIYIIGLISEISERKKSEKKITLLNTQLEGIVKQRTAQLNNSINKLKELNKSLEIEIKKRIEGETKIKNALKKEKELNELKTKFLSMVSHEFKTPLSGILTSTMLLSKYQLNDQQDKRDKYISTIANKVHYLNNILNDFLSLERLNSDKVAYKFSTFNLSKIFNEVVYNANMLLKRGQKINIPNNIDEYILYQDEMFLELALSNLINNAVKYSPQNTSIDIEVAAKNKNLEFKIIDQGIGIPENDQKYIFNRYFRAENALNSQGTGIGLNIVKSHLENLGGSIQFSSKENVGSTFTFELPITHKS